MHQQDYEQGAIDHDQFAECAAAANARLYVLNSVGDIEQSAATFAREVATVHGKLMPFARPLVRKLRQMLIAPVLITGAPLELAREIGRAIGITEVYGLDVAKVQADPAAPLSGTSLGKALVTARIAKEGRALAVAMGDAESDLLMADSAPARLLHEKLLESRPSVTTSAPTQGFTFDTSTSVITEWIDKNVTNFALPLGLDEQDV